LGGATKDKAQAIHGATANVRSLDRGFVCESISQKSKRHVKRTQN
jgi:hypothetical protein